MKKFWKRRLWGQVLFGITMLIIGLVAYKELEVSSSFVSLEAISQNEHLLDQIKQTDLLVNFYGYDSQQSIGAGVVSDDEKPFLLPQLPDYNEIDIVDYNSFVPKTEDLDNETPTFKYIDPQFEQMFLQDMSELDYFELIDGVYKPTDKFLSLAKYYPKKLLDDTFATVEKRLTHDDSIAGNNITTHYELGKGVCRDYAAICTEAWKVLQKYDSGLKNIDVFYVVGKIRTGESHAWVGIKCGNQITYADPAWDDSDGIPLNDLSAVDQYHFFEKS